METLADRKTRTMNEWGDTLRPPVVLDYSNMHMYIDGCEYLKNISEFFHTSPITPPMDNKVQFFSKAPF